MAYKEKNTTAIMRTEIPLQGVLTLTKGSAERNACRFRLKL